MTAIDTASRLSALISDQRAYFTSGATRPIEFRIDALRRLRAALVQNETAILSALFADLRKPEQEAYAAEIGLAISEIDFTLRNLRSWSRPRRRPVPWFAWPSRGQIVPRPLGIALIIGPWNYPFQLSLLPLIGAIAAGNCAVVKPSEISARSSAVLSNVLAATFRRCHVACVEGESAVAAKLLELRFDKIFFTGGATVGRIVAAAGARNLTPVTLELGGKCPAIVCKDANVVVAARRIVWAKTLNAGQACVAPDYLLVDEKVEAALIEHLTAAIREMFGDNPQRSPYYARIINQRHFERLVGYLGDGRIVTGGEHDLQDLYIAPTLLKDIGPDSRIMQEEIFGPLLPILTFSDLTQAIDRVAAGPPPLASYVFTGDRKVVDRIGTQIRCGGICVNDLVVQITGKNLPFGGVGESGMGSYHGKASFDCFSHLQSMVLSSTIVDPPMRYVPPMVSLHRFRRVLPWFLRS